MTRLPSDLHEAVILDGFPSLTAQGFNMSTEMDNDCESDSSESIWSTLLLASSSLLLGYLVGRISYSRDLSEATRLASESSEPVNVVIRTL
jgi:hypothetical protein